MTLPVICIVADCGGDRPQSHCRFSADQKAAVVISERGAEEMSAFLSTYSKEIVALVAPFIAWILNNRFQSRSRLIQSTRHAFTFLIQQSLIGADGKQISPTQTVNTASVSVFNAGRQLANKLEVVFNWKPQHLNMWPSRHYTENTAPDGRYSLHFENLAPKETIGFELLAVNSQLPAMVTVRSDQSVASNLPLIPQPIQPRWKLALAAWLILTGFAANVYVLTLLLQVIVK